MLNLRCCGLSFICVKLSCVLKYGSTFSLKIIRPQQFYCRELVKMYKYIKQLKLLIF